MNDGSMWNDHISQFIRVKALTPHLIAQLVKDQKAFHQEWSKGRKVEEEKGEYEIARQQQEEELVRMKEVVGRKQALHKQMSTIGMEIQFLEMQLQKQQGQSECNHRHSGGSNISGWSQGNEAILKEIQVKIQQLSHKYESKKKQHMQQVDQLLEIKMGLKDQNNRAEQYEMELRRREQKLLQQREDTMHKLKGEHESLSQQNEKLMQDYSALLKKKQQKSRNVQDLSDMVERSRNKLNNLVREMHKFIISGENLASRKAAELRQKCKPYFADPERLLASFQELIATNPSVHFIDTRRDGSFNHYGEELAQTNSLASESPKSPKKKSINPQQAQDLEGLMNYAAELAQRESFLNEEITMLKQNSDRKGRELELEKNRLKQTR